MLETASIVISLASTAVAIYNIWGGPRGPRMRRF